MEAACNKEGVYSSPFPPRATSRQGVLHGVTPDEVGTDMVKWLVRLVEKCVRNTHTYTRAHMCT